ncbi:peptide synthetase [Paenibacillus sambharensis]|uniref:Peptide synthetase n=1 Tax=Paenibacillus sambharensis TaxID=1803190 RepID=A0A2W1LD56_9BACL|nr:amino acid adenylation domain-containing protein [Paenibacillus sambharensis]PZD96000.1 peptide synthetase [Paenibacillus sambharensis]
MRERELMPALELDKAAVSQVLTGRLTDPAVISQSVACLQNRGENEALHAAVFPWIEYTSSQTNHEDFVKREAARPIGCSAKIRAVLAVASDGEADLILTANRELVSVQDLLHVYDCITGGSLSFKISNASRQRYGSYICPKWGVPDWSSTAAYSKSYQIQLTELDFASFSGDKLSIIVRALLTTLTKYGTKNSKVLIEENSKAARKMRTGVLDDNKHIFIKEGIVHDDGAPNAFDAAVIMTDLPDASCQYTPCLASLFPITLRVTQYNGVLHSAAVSASERFVHPAVLEQFVRLLQFYMEASAGGADLEADELLSMPLPQAEEQTQKNTILPRRDGINKLTYSHDLLERLRAISAQYPDRIAVSDQAGAVTYAELDRRSDWIARKLLYCGISEGDKVVVSLDQSVELITIITAVSKAGGTYIPVDPKYPLERIAFVLDDSQAAYIITSLQDVPSKHKLQRISPTELSVEDSDASLDSLVLPTRAANQAYVIYTSGTSGQPKGVMVPSRNIVSLIEATEQEFRLSPKDVWTMFHSASFDFSVWEMWGCLLTGGHLVVVPRQTARSPYDFYDLLADKKVTVLNQTPSAFYALLKVDAENRAARLNAVRLVIFGGEALDTYKISSWLERYPAGCCRLVNMYGITETTVHVTYRNIYSRDPEFLSKSVGTALPGWEISIRDADGTPCLYGVEGEIWVGGAGVSDGYLNREELTRERFVTDGDGERWYRSGDLGRMRPDGSVDYLGRMDSQVKVRGFRIELDEIRSVIQKMPYVRNVAVVLHDGDDVDASQKQIIAFIEGSEQVQPEKIRSDLKSKLPEYMIPARLIRVNEIPMTINGKVDHGSLMLKLDQPEQETAASAGSSEDPFLAIWNRVLGHAIDPDDQFFESGGNSLLAVELLSALKKEVDNSLTLRDLYIHSSPRELQEFLSKKSVG